MIHFLIYQAPVHQRLSFCRQPDSPNQNSTIEIRYDQQRLCPCATKGVEMKRNLSKQTSVRLEPTDHLGDHLNDLGQRWAKFFDRNCRQATERRHVRGARERRLHCLVWTKRFFAIRRVRGGGLHNMRVKDDHPAERSTA